MRVPEGWEKHRFDDISIIANGQVDPKQLPYLDYIHIGPENVESGTGRLVDLKTARELGLISGKYLFDEKAIVYSKIRPNLNKLCLPKFKGICSADMYPIWPKLGVEKDYLFYFMNSPSFLKMTIAASMRTGLPKINREDLGQIKVLVPPPQEQQKIAQILSTWDKAMEKLEALIAAKQKRKKALMQQLLTGKKRFAGFEGEWVIKSIGQILKETKRPVEWDDDAEYKLLSVKRRSEGVVLRERLKGSEILTKKMNVTKSGDFLISKMQVIHGASGLVPPEFSDYHVSDSYIVLVPKNEKSIDINFFSWFSKQKLMYNKALLCSYGVHIEKMTFNFGLYLKEKICIPPTIEEQQKIASVLTAADTEIETHQKQLAALKEQKKGLMQQLLTGKKRVKVDDHV